MQTAVCQQAAYCQNCANKCEMVAMLESQFQRHHVAGNKVRTEEQEYTEGKQGPARAQPPCRAKQGQHQCNSGQRRPWLQQAARGVQPVVIEGHVLRQGHQDRSEEHTSELQSLMRTSYAVFCLKKTKNNKK